METGHPSTQAVNSGSGNRASGLLLWPLTISTVNDSTLRKQKSPITCCVTVQLTTEFEAHKQRKHCSGYFPCLRCPSLLIQSWRPLANYAVKAGVVCLQVKLCDPHLSALEVRFSRRGAIQIYVYLYLTFNLLTPMVVA